MLHQFTYIQAQEIAEDFEDIIDTEHSRGGQRSVIDDVIIRPYKDAAAHARLEDYYGSEDIPLEAVEDTDAPYVVLVVMSSLRDGTVNVQDITDYVAANGISYNFPS